uniref:Uncharacterized protein n=1 Tax=Leersia perrieri TaxID=77586 RepID=A0A0D9WY74_9ORYZ
MAATSIPTERRRGALNGPANTSPHTLIGPTHVMWGRHHKPPNRSGSDSLSPPSPFQNALLLSRRDAFPSSLATPPRPPTNTQLRASRPPLPIPTLLRRRGVVFRRNALRVSDHPLRAAPSPPAGAGQ